MRGRWFLYLAPDYQEKIAVLDAADTRDRDYLVREYDPPLGFLDGALPGDFVDADGGKGERFLVRLGRHWGFDEPAEST
jgi:hypothetical protein